MENHILLIIAIIIIVAKLASSFSIKLKQPPVLGMLLIGVVLGHSVFGLINTSPTTGFIFNNIGFSSVKVGTTIEFFAEIGVIFLLFMAGLETDINAMKKTGKSSLFVALAGVIIPFVSGFAIGNFFGFSFFKTMIVATIFTATSVSVSVMTLLDMKRLRSVEGSIILGAAVIDDIIAIILLTFVFGLSNPTAVLSFTFLKMFGFIVISILFGFFFINPIVQLTKKLKAEQSILSIAIGICLLYSFAAHAVEIAPITGAYLAGLFLGRTDAKMKIMEGIETLGQSIFVSIFFVNIGLSTQLWGQGLEFKFAAIFVLGAAFTKVLGSSFGAKISGFSWKRSVPIGFGMMPRGEVALVIANMAIAKGLFTSKEFSATVFMVVITALLTPFLLKWSFNRKN